MYIDGCKNTYTYIYIHALFQKNNPNIEGGVAIIHRYVNAFIHTYKNTYVPHICSHAQSKKEKNSRKHRGQSSNRPHICKLVYTFINIYKNTHANLFTRKIQKKKKNRKYRGQSSNHLRLTPRPLDFCILESVVPQFLV